MAALKDDHIVTVYQVGEDGDVPFLAMELLEGVSLSDRSHHSEPLDWPAIVRIGRDIARGLAVAHAKGMIHRDIKPANIWLEGSRGRVKILDFGLARPVTDDVQLTASGALVGTPSYMSPEQARGKKLDGRADLFSLGVLLYKLSTGRQPFQGENLIELLTSLAVDTPGEVSTMRTDIPPKLAELIHQLLAKYPDIKIRRRLGTFMLDVRGEPFVIGPTVHYRGNPEVEKHIVYVAQLEDGSNITLSRPSSPSTSAGRMTPARRPSSNSTNKVQVSLR